MPTRAAAPHTAITPNQPPQQQHQRSNVTQPATVPQPTPPHSVQQVPPSHVSTSYNPPQQSHRSASPNQLVPNTMPKAPITNPKQGICAQLPFVQTNHRNLDCISKYNIVFY
jgi:hypothetical protein